MNTAIKRKKQPRKRPPQLARDDKRKSPSGEYKVWRPYGPTLPVQNLDPRAAKYLPPGVQGSLNFAQTFHLLLWEQQRLDTETAEALYEAERTHANSEHPFYTDEDTDGNTEELPWEVLRRAVSQAPGYVLHKPVVQRALARLYAVAWYGKGPEAGCASAKLIELLPSRGRGRPPHRIAEHLPAIIKEYQMRLGWIRWSAKTHSADFGSEEERDLTLAAAYDEKPEVIRDALTKSERRFLEDRLVDPNGPKIPRATAETRVKEYLQTTRGQKPV